MAMSPVQLSVDMADAVDDTAWVVREVSLRLGEGEILALLGGPGAGKSALLAAIAGERRLGRGDIRLDEHSLNGLDTTERLRRGIAHARQRPATFRGLTVGEHLSLGHVASRTRRSVARSRVLRVIPELAGRERQSATRLERGDARLLDVGRALMSAPAVLLLDEPSLDLDTGRCQRLLDSLRDEGIGVLLAERYPEPALSVADRACLMLAGRIVAEGPAETLRDDWRLLPACAGELSAS